MAIEKMTQKRKKYNRKKKSYGLLIAVLLVLAAVFAGVVTDYINFKNGKSSLLFSRRLSPEDQQEKGEAFNRHFWQVLDQFRLTPDYFQEDDKGQYHFKLTLSSQAFNRFISRVEGICRQQGGKIKLKEVQRLNDHSRMLYLVKFGSRITHTIRVTRSEKVKIRSGDTAKETGKEAQKPRIDPKPGKKTGKSGTDPITQEISPIPRMAFIIDDVGEYELGALELKKLNIPITASILPDSPGAHQEALWVEEYQLKAIIHLPMQPMNSNGKTYNPEEVITLKSTDEQIRNLIERARNIVPNAQGINNHEGSLVTSRPDIMNRVLKIIKEEDLFFIDSRTIGSTVAYDIARQLQIKTAAKDLFIDHVQTYSHSLAQIQKLVDIARKNGKAIGIGHPRPTTLKAIQDSLPLIQARGIKIVYVSELLE